MRKVSALLAITAMLLAACGGGVEPIPEAPQPLPPAVTNGALAGPVISGIDYASCDSSGCTQVGVTDATGAFTQARDRRLHLSFGTAKWFIGPAQPSGRMLDFSFTEDEFDVNFLNKMTLLYSIDEDGNPDNGIQVSTVAKASLNDRAIDFGGSADEFANNSAVVSLVRDITTAQASGAVSMYRAEAVREHLTRHYFKSQYEGQWQFYFDGAPEDEPFSTEVSSTGVITGAGEAGKGGDQSMRAQVAYVSNPTTKIQGGLVDGMSVIGTLSADGTGSGSYTISTMGNVVTGSWTAKKGPPPEKNT